MTISGSQKPSGNHLTASPISFERILVGTDFSEPAQLAFDIALEFAEQFGSHLSIAHAISLMLPSMASAGIVPEAVDALVQSAKEELDKVIRLHRTNVASIEKVVAFGGAEEVLLGTVREKKIDLLVLGTHASLGIARIALGSVAESVMRHVPCPVLIAGPRCQRTSNLFRSILFATDLTTTGTRAARYAAALAEQFQSLLTMFHAMEKKESVAGGRREECENASRLQLEFLLPEAADLWCRPHMELAYGDPAEEILAMENNCDATLIVTGTGHHRALADHSPHSTLSKVLHVAKCPVLAVPDISARG
ncbi:universal stress protein [Terriglobus albidus]|uniref:Universal stress protein n=1 Tax=Terriglobus albidus TaxID=1592106 RepID=A0A5B9EEW5_9BACT|nr:universal stress protein [Terriglobus albidus]QEE28596.1 universal stress protein [Terriglobus albidus]